jgi:hypothetical protein
LVIEVGRPIAAGESWKHRAFEGLDGLILTLGLLLVDLCRKSCINAIMPTFVDFTPQLPRHDATVTEPKGCTPSCVVALSHEVAHMKNTLCLSGVTCSLAVSVSTLPFSDQAAVISFFVSNKRSKATRARCGSLPRSRATI